MALTITEVQPRQSVGQYWERVVDILFDSSYPTGGEAFVPADVGFAEGIFFFESEDHIATVRRVAYDRANGKLLAYDPDGAQISDTTSLSTITVRAKVTGR